MSAPSTEVLIDRVGRITFQRYGTAAHPMVAINQLYAQRERDIDNQLELATALLGALRHIEALESRILSLELKEATRSVREKNRDLDTSE